MGNNSGRTAISYGRNSSGKEKSVSDQLAANRDEAERLGVTITAELSDGTSASRFAARARRNWAQILNSLPAVDMVMLWEPSRGDRDLETWVAFIARCREQGTVVHATGYRETYDPRNPRHWRALMEDGLDASYETEKMSMRIRRGVASSAAAGRPYGPCVYGYRRLHDERTGELTGQEPDPETAPVVREIITRVARAESIRSIYADLNQRGVASPKGSRWGPATTKDIVRHVEYIGMRRHRDNLYRATWEPIVDEVTWHAANRVLDDPARRAHIRPGAARYLLSGIVTCVNCGGRIGVSLAQAYAGPRYVCRDCGTTAAIADLDEYVSRIVTARMCRKDARRVFGPRTGETAAAEAELARLQAKITEARESFATGDGISAEALATTERILLPKIADARQRAVPAGASLAVLDLADAGRLGQSVVRPLWDGMPVATKREVLRVLFASLAVEKPRRRLTRWATEDERLTAMAERLRVDWRKP